MTHTIGPWRVDHCNPGPTTGEWMIAGGKPGYLAEVRDCGSGDVRANARLIAAAPDMLKALQRITHPMADDDDVAFALDVIARATGEAQP